MNNEKNEKESLWDKSFLVDFWSFIFYLLSKVSLFDLIRNIPINYIGEDRKSKSIFRSRLFVDIWVIINLILSIISPIILYNIDFKYKTITWIILIYSIARTFEIIIYQINVLLFHEYRIKKRKKQNKDNKESKDNKKNKYEIYSVPRMVICLLQNYIEIIFWVATMVIFVIKLQGSEITFTLGYILRASVMCMTIYDIDAIASVCNNTGQVIYNIAFSEAICGFVMTLISLGRFIGLLPSVNEKN